MAKRTHKERTDVGKKRYYALNLQKKSVYLRRFSMHRLTNNKVYMR